MLYWAAIFLAVSLISAAFGFGGLSVESAWIGKSLFCIFAALFVLALVAHLIRRAMR